jgi:long-chain acyl-CoA synthetase
MRAPNVANYLENSALAHPNKVALIFDDQKKWTFKEVDETVNRIANGLLQIGVGKGDRVTLFLPNSPESIFFYFGIMKIGAIVNPLNLMLKERELRYIVGDCEPTIIVTAKEVEEEPLRVLKGSDDSVKMVIIVDGEDGQNILDYKRWVEKSSDQFDAVKVDSDDIAAILYTSGTTGHPKGVMLTHANLWTNARHCADWAETTYRDISVSSLPLFHSYALSHVVGELWMSGGTLVWQKRFDATATFETMVKHKATCFMGVATMYYALVNHPEVDEYAKKINLRYAITGAAVTPEPILRAWNKKFVPLSEGYGTTEAAPVVCVNPVSPVRGAQKANSCGIPLVPEIEMKVVDEEGKEVARGSVGELLIRGPNIMKGYWEKPEATDEALVDGWYHSGDMVYQDEDGYYYVKDRKKDMIVRAAFNIYPKEIEDLLYTHPAIAEAQVLGIPDLIKGEEVVACIACKPGQSLTVEQVIKLCKDNMASYKAPKYVRFFESLPKTATGKLEKVSLRRVVEQEIGRN